MRLMASRDPVSVAFDAAARRLLERAYASRGEWVQTWLPDPDIRQRTRWIGEGIVVDGPDPMPPGGGGVNAHTRWARALVRSLYYQARWHAPSRGGTQLRDARRTVPASVPLRVQVGRHVAAAGVLPARRRVRVMVTSSGAARDRALAREPLRDRIYADGQGQPGPRHATRVARDWS